MCEDVFEIRIWGQSPVGGPRWIVCSSCPATRGEWCFGPGCCPFSPGHRQVKPSEAPLTCIFHGTGQLDLQLPQPTIELVQGQVVFALLNPERVSGRYAGFLGDKNERRRFHGQTAKPIQRLRSGQHQFRQSIRAGRSGV